VTTRLTLTNKLDVQAAVDLATRMAALPSDADYVFDFAPLTWAEPLGALYAANAIRQFVNERHPGRVLVANFQTTLCHSYLGHIGFFRAFGLDYGKGLGEARGSSSYLPITEVDISNVMAEAYDTERTLGDLIHRKADGLVDVLTQQTGGEGKEALVFAFREVMRNAVEHSESSKLWFSAQFWPKNGAATIALLDTGDRTS
jgi:hypothetical protein